MKKDFIEWKDSYNIGIKFIDVHHKKLLEIANKLYDSCSFSTEHATTDFISSLTEIKKYMTTHFSEEEALMEKYNYPGLAKHKNEHSLFIETVTKEEKQIESKQEVKPFNFTIFLKEWVLHHIAITDNDYKLYFKKIGIPELNPSFVSDAGSIQKTEAANQHKEKISKKRAEQTYVLSCFSSEIMSIISGLNHNSADASEKLNSLLKTIGQDPEFMQMSISEMKYKVYEKILLLAGDPRYYTQAKSKLNDLTSEVCDQIRKTIANSHDPLCEILKFSTAANTLDSTILEKIKTSQDLYKHLVEMKNKLETQEFSDLFRKFKSELFQAKKIIFIPESCGEILIDDLLLGKMKEFNPDLSITLLVKRQPYLAQVSGEDEVISKLQSFLRLGFYDWKSAGIMQNKCSEGVSNMLSKSNMIISKGFDNCSNLNESTLNHIFFLAQYKNRSPFTLNNKKLSAGDFLYYSKQTQDHH